MKQTYTSFCFYIILSTNLLNTKIAFLVPLSDMKPYCTSYISLSVLPLILFIITIRTSFVTCLIKLSVRCFSHLAVPFTFGIVIHMELYICYGKRPSLYIIFAKFIISVTPLPQVATIISVVISSGPGAFLIGIPFKAYSIYVRVIGDIFVSLLISGIPPLASCYDDDTQIYLQCANITTAAQ